MAAAWAVAVSAVAVVGGPAMDTSRLVPALYRPSWQPPGAVFGPVWTLLYVLIAVAATLASRDVRGTRRCRLVLGLFAANLVLLVATALTWTIAAAS